MNNFKILILNRQGSVAIEFAITCSALLFLLFASLELLLFSLDKLKLDYATGLAARRIVLNLDSNPSETISDLVTRLASHSPDLISVTHSGTYNSLADIPLAQNNFFNMETVKTSSQYDVYTISLTNSYSLLNHLMSENQKYKTGIVLPKAVAPAFATPSGFISNSLPALSPDCLAKRVYIKGPYLIYDIYDIKTDKTYSSLHNICPPKE